MLSEKKSKTLLDILKEQKTMKLKGNIYHYTQIKFAYNTNRIEGSKLSEDETRFIFETNTLISKNEIQNIDDIVETANHFYLFDVMLEKADILLNEELIKEYHKILKQGTEDSRKEWFNVGEYKSLANEVGGKETTKPKDVEKEIKKLLNWYNLLEVVTLKEIVEFHYRFEKIHPFQDGNGRVGRAIMFKECLKYNIVPFIIEDSFKAFYYRGLSNYEEEKGFLEETCLAMQDNYKEVIKKFLS
ncbi:MULTISPECIES: Fic family protein [Cetobacterium]|uniref:Fic family protein n=1 Tax=Candidatus Cetobacterium colombiensis TaxID=3073100 RepID=A0ABU4WBG7_9FUSO|nr:Fic family protein [Candidatus Cetobacterium colombiensis]MDX8335901.1 Fic family protein [Candidatus Cetobacterium colombiensis]